MFKQRTVLRAAPLRQHSTDAVFVAFCAGRLCLLGLNVNEVVIRRSDERAGSVQVHFPRFGFQIRKGTRP